MMKYLIKTEAAAILPQHNYVATSTQTYHNENVKILKFKVSLGILKVILYFLYIFSVA